MQGLADDADSGILIFVLTLDVQKDRGAKKGCSAARLDTFFDRCTRCVEGVVDAVLLFLHFNFRRAPDADDGNAASELGKTFLQLFAVIVRVSSI